MERFTDKNMSESQITEIVELMNGEHAEALKLWGQRNENGGIVTGFCTGIFATAVGAGLSYLAVKMTTYAWAWGKGCVEFVKHHKP